MVALRVLVLSPKRRDSQIYEFWKSASTSVRFQISKFAPKGEFRTGTWYCCSRCIGLMAQVLRLYLVLGSAHDMLWYVSIYEAAKSNPRGSWSIQDRGFRMSSITHGSFDHPTCGRVVSPVRTAQSPNGATLNGSRSRRLSPLDRPRYRPTLQFTPWLLGASKAIVWNAWNGTLGLTCRSEIDLADMTTETTISTEYFEVSLSSRKRGTCAPYLRLRLAACHLLR